MKTLNIGRNRIAKQKGFTIIELVVVILLLGILTATALPRFMDISDEAHQAVVDATTGSLRTGLALYRAQWMAEGQPDSATAISYDGSNLFPEASGSGYPASLDGTLNDGIAAYDGSNCLEVFTGLITFGGLATASTEIGADTAATETAIELAAVGTDWVATGDLTLLSTNCIFYYTGQYKSGTDANQNTIQTLAYNTATGTVTLDVAGYTFLTDP
jgi:prepilin-type N-terminal cleavage/methylation domain-containing protein